MPDRPRRLLILRTGSLGDIVHAVPAVWAVRRRFPAARIEWLVEGRFAPVLRGIGCVDEVIELPAMPGRHPWVRGFVETLAVAGLRGRRYDAALDLQGLLRTAGWAVLAGARVRLGPDDWREGAPLLYTRTLPRGDAPHVVDQWLAMAGHLGAATDRVGFHLRPGDDDVRKSLQTLTGGVGGVVRSGLRWVMVFPRTTAARKDWPAGRWAEVAGRLAGKVGVGVLVAGGAAERAACEAIVAEARRGLSTAAAEWIVSCFPPLELLKTLLAGAAAVAGGDSGPVHWAAAMGTPVVSLFGPTDPERLRPRGDGRIEVLRRAQGCRACAVAVTRRGTAWPWGPEHACMAAIEVADVQAALERVLGGPDAGRLRG